MNFLSLVACRVLLDRIERNNEALKRNTDPIVIQTLEDEIQACKYAIEQLERGKIYETD